MTLVEIYSKRDCHLCDIAKEVVQEVKQSYSFELREILIQEGDEQYEQFKERIPVLFVNGKFAFQYRVNKQEFIKRLQEESVSVV